MKEKAQAYIRFIERFPIYKLKKTKKKKAKTYYYKRLPVKPILF
jgi:hypothetical protein